MESKMKLQKDSKLTGFLSGLVLPPVFMYLYWLIFLRTSLPDLVIFRLMHQSQLAPLIGLSQLVNAGLFFFFIKKWEADESSKGVIFAMLVYGAIIVYLKLDTLWM
jgi:hypothetical protein